MEPFNSIDKPPSHKREPQLNLNSVLLIICVGLSSWALKSISDLQEQISALLPVVNANGTAIVDINRVDDRQTNKIDDLANRLTKLETTVTDQLNVKK